MLTTAKNFRKLGSITQRHNIMPKKINLDNLMVWYVANVPADTITRTGKGFTVAMRRGDRFNVFVAEDDGVIARDRYVGPLVGQILDEMAEDNLMAALAGVTDASLANLKNVF